MRTPKDLTPENTCRIEIDSIGGRSLMGGPEVHGGVVDRPSS